MKNLFQSRNYERLGSEGSEDDDTKTGENPGRARSNHPILGIVLTILNIGLLILHGALFAHASSSPKAARNQQLRDCSYFSPFFDRLEIPYATKQINASLANEDDSIWRKPPSADVDAAWDRVSKLGYHTVTSADVVALGKNPELTVRAPAHWGMGDDAHIVQLDVTHQIHCLNAIRKAMYPEYYPVRRVMKDVHPQHCLHVLLQNLMCDASVDVMTYNWMETQRNPFPDMSINKKCRDYEAVLKWHEEHLVPLTEKVYRPEGAREIHLTPKLRELLEAHEGDNPDDTVGDTGR
ncbi:hypothetical protein CONLIGDRAFT_680257 [Coniochaeta ligniaria NRRL 30616]|uniref:Tat pathway signal sequence n=1 Tax=Coniochaeta ligniaria NRRL 30616 TaxID=1408157 RepID=A0A1J7IP55_9PEZI|nr:hypothetical protein CONLIGDRAFT_680257 [Coniochaeta ligniaria NRRL 30616]